MLVGEKDMKEIDAQNKNFDVLNEEIRNAGDSCELYR